MAIVITHFFEGGTESQYNAVAAAAHAGGKLPAGQSEHLAGPTDGGWLVVSVWDSQDQYDTFLSGTLLPALQTVEGGFVGPPTQERTAPVVASLTA